MVEFGNCVVGIVSESEVVVAESPNVLEHEIQSQSPQTVALQKALILSCHAWLRTRFVVYNGVQRRCIVDNVIKIFIHGFWASQKGQVQLAGVADVYLAREMLIVAAIQHEWAEEAS